MFSKKLFLLKTSYMIRTPMTPRDDDESRQHLRRLLRWAICKLIIDKLMPVWKKVMNHVWIFLSPTRKYKDSVQGVQPLHWFGPRKFLIIPKTLKNTFIHSYLYKVYYYLQSFAELADWSLQICRSLACLPPRHRNPPNKSLVDYTTNCN